jgi:hypothetical protein
MHEPSALSEWLFASLRFIENAFDNEVDPLPGIGIEELLTRGLTDSPNSDLYANKLWGGCRKLCLSWEGKKRALHAEADFYSTTTHGSPALFGKEAVALIYHLEATVLFARSALDLLSTVFGGLWPDTLKSKRYDSFNDFSKDLIKMHPQSAAAKILAAARDEDRGWFGMLCGAERGRALRDKIAHQIEFPIGYEELDWPSEKESAIVILGQDKYLPLPDFLHRVTRGPLNMFCEFEKIIIEARQQEANAV